MGPTIVCLPKKRPSHKWGFPKLPLRAEVIRGGTPATAGVADNCLCQPETIRGAAQTSLESGEETKRAGRDTVMALRGA